MLSTSFPQTFRTSVIAISLLYAASLVPAQTPLHTSTSTSFNAAAERDERHATLEWQSIADHLPNPNTATPEELLAAADILRARKLQEDAIEYYNYALARGGDQPVLLNRIGVTELEVNQLQLARLCFKRVVLLKQKYAEGWNNLGATEMIAGNQKDAIHLYQKAIKLQKKNATFHANLGTAYFAAKDFESARHEFEVAVKLDESVFRHGGFGGTQIHVLTGEDRGRFNFEMARLAAAHHADENMLNWLAKAVEAGFDIRTGMADLKDFEPYRHDARVLLLTQNAKAMRSRQLASSGPLPTLPPVAAKTN